MLGTILIVVLILMLLGAMPTWGHSRNWGYGPSGGLGLVVIVLVVLLLTGRIWSASFRKSNVSRAMNKLKLVAIAGIALIVVIVVLQNTQTVETKLLFLTVTLPNAALL